MGKMYNMMTTGDPVRGLAYTNVITGIVVFLMFAVMLRVLMKLWK